MTPARDLAVLAKLRHRMRPPAPDTFAKLGYEPTPPQHELHTLPTPPYVPTVEGVPFTLRAGVILDVLYGGALGGGKTKALLMDALLSAERWPGVRCYCFRRTYPELEDSFIAELAGVGYARALGARYIDGKHVLILPNGSTVRFRYAQSLKDATRYQGAEIHRLYIDERGLMLPSVVGFLSSRVRAGKPAFTEALGIRSSTNPGGPGHADMRAKFVDPAPPRTFLVDDDYELPAAEQVVELHQGADGVHRPVEPPASTRYFIPALMRDNPHLDPGYAGRMRASFPDDNDYLAMAEGDWDRFTGQRFGGWRRRRHVVLPEELPIPGGVLRGIGIDYGLDAPFVALWGALMADGLIVVYREVDGTGLTPEEQAGAILAAEDTERVGQQPRAAIDPATFARDPAHPRATSTDPKRPPAGSIAARYVKSGVPVVRGNNDRLLGVAEVASRLKVRCAAHPLTAGGCPEDCTEGMPRLIVYSTCTNLVRTLPAAPRDEQRPEDVDRKWPDDHWYDALRYLLLDLGRRNPANTAAEAMKAKMAAAKNARGGTITGGLKEQGF